MCASVRACVRPSVWDIIQKNKRDLKRESSRESLREEQLQASRQASKQLGKQASKQASTRKAFSLSHALEGLVSKPIRPFFKTMSMKKSSF